MKKRPATPRPVTCAVCKTVFETRHSQGKYCSLPCSRTGERKSWREYGDRNRERRRLYHNALYLSEPEKVIDRVVVYRQTDAGKAATKTSALRGRQKHPEKFAARIAVSSAIKSGKIIKKSCERCGERKTHAHHPDYSRPLDVVWLCHLCHAAEHGRLVNPKLLAKTKPKEGALL